MKVYLNKNGNSPVTYYHIANSFIIVRFSGSEQDYVYSYSGGAGKVHVEKMKVLAFKGAGLSKYINQNVKQLFDK